MKNRKQILKFCQKHKIYFLGFGIFLFLVLVVCCFFNGRNYSYLSQDVWKTSENIRNFYQKKPNYWGLNSAMVIKHNLGENFKVRENKLYNRLGQEVFIGSGNNGDVVMPGGKDFNIIYKNIDKKFCADIVSYMPDGKDSLGLRSIRIENSLITEFAWGGRNKLPISPAVAEQACGEKNNLIWNFE